MSPSRIILCTTDPSEESYRLLADTIKTLHCEVAKVCLLQVGTQNFNVSRDPQDGAESKFPRKNVNRYIEWSRDPQRTLDNAEVSPTHQQPMTGTGVVKLANGVGADLIIVTVQDTPENLGPLGQEVNFVMHQASCPVLVLKSSRDSTL